MERAEDRWTATRRALLAGLPAMAAAACAPRRDPRALTFWAISYEGDYAPHLMPAFTRRTGIPVEVQTLPASAAHEKLLTAQAGGALPDVMMLYNGWVGTFAMIGALRPVPDAALVADQFPGVLRSAQWLGRDYAVPWSVAPQGQFYRRDLVQRAGYAAPPTDWAEWRRMAAAIKRRAPDDYVILAYLNWWDLLVTLAGLTGARPLRERDTRGNFASPEFREALGFYTSLFDDGYAPVALSTDIQDPVAAFAQGYFAVYPSSPTIMLDFRRRTAELPPDRWGVTRMPGPTGPGRVSSISASVAVTTASRRPDDAWALVRHLTSAASELRFQQLIETLPARASAWNSAQMREPHLVPFARQVREPAIWPAIAEWEQIQIEVQLIAERVVRKLLTIDQGVATMDREADRILAKRRALVQAGRIA